VYIEDIIVVLVADRIPHVCGGIQEESRTNMDYETSC